MPTLESVRAKVLANSPKCLPPLEFVRSSPTVMTSEHYECRRVTFNKSTTYEVWHRERPEQLFHQIRMNLPSGEEALNWARSHAAANARQDSLVGARAGNLPDEAAKELKSPYV